jgi:hypothetical protein
MRQRSIAGYEDTMPWCAIRKPLPIPCKDARLWFDVAWNGLP